MVKNYDKLIAPDTEGEKMLNGYLHAHALRASMSPQEWANFKEEHKEEIAALAEELE